MTNNKVWNLFSFNEIKKRKGKKQNDIKYFAISSSLISFGKTFLGLQFSSTMLNFLVKL